MVSANRFDRIYEQLAKKYGRSKRQIKDICDSPFLMIGEFYKMASKIELDENNVEENKFQILLNNFGKFKLSKRIICLIKKKKQTEE